ncbi:MAG: Transcription elongation factor GreA [Verrucomicrobiae bacterium]|nr:Transcription elongation factor GreA [Verrucomicrobiae bacterium]
MPSTTPHHESLKNLLTQRKFAEAEALWLDLAEQLHDKPDFLLLLVKEFADAGQPRQAAELAALLAPNLKADGKDHEWLYALKLQANANPADKPLRAELLAAYTKIFAQDARLKAIITVAQLDSSAAPLPSAIAKTDSLLSLKTGGFCLHKSWGLGQVKQFDTALNRVVVAFPHNPSHAMQLAYAAESLLPVNPDHIEVRKQTDLPGIKQLATTDPIALIRAVLISYNHSATAEKIEATLAGSVIPTPDWKKWWDTTKKLLKRDPHFDVPGKKNEPLVLRSAPVAQQDEFVETFRTAPSLKQKTELARQLLKIIDDIADPELLLQEFQDGLLAALKKLKATYAADRLEAAFIIEDLRAHQKTPAASTAPLVDEILAGVRDLPELLEDLTTSTRKRVIAAQTDRLLNDINRLPVKTLDEMTAQLEPRAEQISQMVRNKTASAELLVWVCKNFDTHPWLLPLQSAATLQAIINASDSGTAKERRRLRDLLFNDDELIANLLLNADTDTVKEVSRQLLNTPAFEELDRRSLMARIVRVFPFVQEFLVTKSTKEQPLIVSKASYDKRRTELDEIVTKRIPENSKEIGVARSYGDLRENFEFKAAKDLQKVLMRRRAELEILLARAQTTNFADAKPDLAGIGTTVTVTDLATNQVHTYHILGAWDSDPARGIISYPAALAQALFNKKAGDVIEAAGDTGKLKLRIDSIVKTPDAILQSL